MTESEIIKQRNNDFLQTFEGSPQGKRTYDFLAEFCLKDSCTFVEGSPDKSDFNQGVRVVILEIDHWMKYDLSTLEETSETDNEEPDERD